jgi:hypothetical protein
MYMCVYVIYKFKASLLCSCVVLGRVFNYRVAGELWRNGSHYAGAHWIGVRERMRNV